MSYTSERPEEQWLERERLVRLLRDEQSFGVPFRLLLLGLIPLLWLTAEPVLPGFVVAAVWGGLLLIAIATWRVLQPVGRLRLPVVRQWIAVAFAADLLLVLLALLLDGTPESDLYLLFVPLIFKTVLLFGGWSGIAYLPFLIVPLYALMVAMHSGRWNVWVEPFLLRRTALLLLVTLVSLYFGRALHKAREQARQLNLGLGQRKADLDTRTLVLTQTATNLATRVLELQSLQKGMKAINASLDLNRLLGLVVENASEVFGGASCAIGLRESDGAMGVAARSQGPEVSLAATEAGSLQSLAAQVVERRAPVLLESRHEDDDTLTTAMAVPMEVDGEPIGALVAMRVAYSPFTSDDQERLSAFADQAALAVKNSRLYKRIEQLYQEVKERSDELEAVLHSIGDAVIVTGSEGQVRLTNPVASVILGLPDDVVPETPLPEPVRGGAFEDHLRATLTNESGDPLLGELTVHGVNLQGNRTYQALSAPLRDQKGRPRGVVTVLRDVTAAKDLELLKTNFVSTISHELKTPLHSIKGFVDIILSERSTGSLTELQRDFLSTVRDQTVRLERMILDLLEFNRLESGQIKLNPEPLDLAILAEAVTEQLIPVAEETDVSLVCMVEASLPVEGDRLRIEQVFNNLIANAIKFTPPGGRITVTGAQRGSMMEIIVRDTGIGIPLYEQERIFERFYQVDASQTRKYGGAGLGLAICKHIVERHGGRIWVESEIDRGSAFHFTLPRELGVSTPLMVDFSRLEAG